MKKVNKTPVKTYTFDKNIKSSYELTKRLTALNGIITFTNCTDIKVKAGGEIMYESVHLWYIMSLSFYDCGCQAGAYSVWVFSLMQTDLMEARIRKIESIYSVCQSTEFWGTVYKLISITICQKE